MHGKVCTQLILIAIGIENITRNASAHRKLKAESKKKRDVSP